MRHMPIALSIAAALAALPAARADKQTPPAAAAPRPFALPSHQDAAFDNGLKVTTVAYGSVAKAAVVLMIRGGNAEEDARGTWLADLMGRSLGEGTRSQTAAQLAEAAAAMGGDLEVGVEADQTTITLEVLSEFAPRAIALVADVARNPAFPPADVARVQSDLVRQLAVLQTQPGQLAREQFSAALYPDHAYGRTMPTEALLKSYTVDQVRAFHAAHVGAARSKEVARLRAEPPPADELRGIQSYLAGVFVLRNSTRQGIVRQLNFLEKHGLADDYLRNFAQRVWAVTPADVQRIASTYLDPKKMAIVVVGDRKQVDGQLTPWTGGGKAGGAPGGK